MLNVRSFSPVPSYVLKFAAIAAMAFLTACGGQPSEDTQSSTSGIVFSPKNPSIAHDGTITFSASGGTAPYTYGIVSGGGTIVPTTGVFTAPSTAGTVVIGLIDGAGHTASTNVTVYSSPVISPATATILAGATQAFSVSGGKMAYTYSVQSGGGSINSSGLYTSASAGTVIVRVTDSLGQYSESTLTVIPPLTISPSTLNLGVNGNQTFTAAGGVSPYTFSVLSGGGSINASTGDYTAPATAGSVTIQVADSASHTVTATVTIVDALTISPTTWTLAAGNLKTFAGAGGLTPYTYSVVSGGGSINASTGAYTAPMSSGSATVRVSDAFGQTADATITINPALTISPATLSIVPNGTQTFSAAGGVSPYAFSIVSGGGSIDPVTGAFTAPAGAATVIVRVTDSLSNMATSTVTVQAALSISPTTQSLAVNNTYTFSAAGGTGPYTFSVFSGSGSVNSSSGLYTAPASSGSAVVRVTDNLGATADANVTINPALSLSPSTWTMNTSATKTFAAAGGVSPYVYSVVSGGGSMNSSTGDYTAPAAPASVTVRVTDALGNTADSTITVLYPLVITPSTWAMTVNNLKTFVASGGSGTLTFSVVSGGGSINSSTGDFTPPVAPATVTLRVTDGIGQTTDATVTVTAALSISPATVTVALNGSQTFSATGGVSPLVYSIVSGGGSINSSSGAYTAPASNDTALVRVTDALGNTSHATVSVHDPLAIAPTTWTLAVNNTKTFTASGGVGPYTYSVFSGTGSVNSSTGVYTAPASSGSAVVRVTDSLGATADAAVTINPALAISPATVTVALNGSQTFSATGGVTPYTYSIVSGGGSINSSSGAYTAPGTAGSVVVRVTDNLGNMSDSNVSVANTVVISPTTWTLAVTNTKTFSATGGQAPYTYSKVSGTGTINSSSGLYTAPASSGSAVVRVTDSFGQTADATITINAALAISPTTWAMATNGTKTFSATGGVTPYTYSVFSGGGSINSSSGAYTAGATAGAVTVRVTDSVGNTSNSTVTVVDPLVISPATTNLLIDDLATFTATGGQAPYTYSVFTGGGSIDPSTGDFTAPSAADTVTVRVTDNLGLTSDATVNVYEPLVISPTTITLAPTNTNAFSASGGLGALTYSIVSGTGSINATTGDYTAGASAGTDIVRVTDSIGNTSDATVTVNGALTINPLSKTISINETFTFTATNGVGPYSYAVTSGGGSIDPVTGVYTAGSVSETGIVVEVEDSLGNTSTAAVTVITPIKMWVGGYNTCVKYDNNALKCWGDGAGGKLGAGNTTDRGDNANEMGSNLAFMDLGAGRYPKDMAISTAHTCAILDNDSLKCWGTNTKGQLGYGDTVARGDTANEMGDNLAVVNVGTGRTVKKVAVGPTNTCAVLDDDTLKCWGLNTYGQNGKDNTTQLGSAANQMGDNLTAINLGAGRTAKDVSVGQSHTCALLDNNTVKCWGRNNRGQLGQGNTTTLGDGAGEMAALAAISLGAGRTVTAISSGYTHNCVILDDGTVKCWGQNTNGQLGQGSTSHRGDGAGEMGDSLAVTPLGTGRTAVQIFSHYFWSCAVLDDGGVKCWGYNTYGNLGQGSTAAKGDNANELGDNMSPIDFNSTLSQLGMGYTHACMMSTDNQVKCWGRATQGALGNASTTSNIGDAANEMGINLPRVNL